MLVTEDEARKMFFSPETRPTPSQMERLRQLHHLPAMQFGQRVLYWTDELENHLNTIQHRKPPR